MPRVIRGNPACEDCNLCNISETVCLMGIGRIPCDILIVGDTLGFAESRQEVPFVSKSYDLLEDLLIDADIDMTRVYRTHAVKCRTSDGKPPSQKQIKACRPWLEKEIKTLKPKFVLLLGAVALKTALNATHITDIHGNPIEKDGITYFPIFSPGLAIRDPKKLPPIRRDIERFAKVVSGNTEIKHKLNLTIVNDMASLKALCEELLRCNEFAYDIETTGLNRFADDAKVTVITLATGRGEWVIPFNLDYRGIYFHTHEAQRQIIDLIFKCGKGKVTIAHGAKFDDIYLEEQYAIKPYIVFDTMLAGHLLNENTPNKLKSEAQDRLDAHNWDIDIETKKGGISTEEEFKKLCEYAAWDGYFTLRLKWLYDKLLAKDEALHNLFYKMSMPAQRAYERLEKNGTYLDLKKLDYAEKQIKKNIEKCLINLNECYSKYFTAWEHDHWAGGIDEEDEEELRPLDEVNWNSTQQVAKVLFSHFNLTATVFTPKGDPSTGESALIKIRDSHPIIEHLLEYRTQIKLLTGFINSWRNKITHGCYIYPSFLVSGTVTGRPSCSNPNLQQVPRNKLIRSIISAPEGWVFFEVDFSQIELRILAEMSQDPVMLAAYRTGEDLHALTASKVLGIPIDKITYEQRNAAKAVNFGFMYGMHAPSFIEYALQKFNVRISLKEGEKFRKKYFEVYAGIPPWHERQKRIVRAMGEVRTLTGRIRRLPEIESPDRGMRGQAERNAVNSPVQGLGAEYTLAGLIEFDKVADPKEIKVCGTIHDAMVGIVKERKAKHWMRILKDKMENAEVLKELGVDLSVPIIVDCSLGDWGAGEEIEL